MKFSIIMASYLEEYKNCASNREEKFIRAVDSVINQSFKDWELIIISDGCEKTIKHYKKDYIKYHPKIQCLSIQKQKGNFTGVIREKGIEIAVGDYITYLDTDDYFNSDHLKNLADNISNYDWVYYDNYIDGKLREIDYYRATTSSITHKNKLDVTWKGCNGYGHESSFIWELFKKYKYHKKINYTGYVVCHTVNGIDE